MSAIDDEVAGIGRNQVAHPDSCGPASRAEDAAGGAASGRRIQAEPSRPVDARPESVSRHHQRLRRQDQNDGGHVEAAGRDGLAERPVCEPAEDVDYRAVCLCAGEAHGHQLSDREFPARRLDAPDRQHVVPVAGGICSGRRVGTLAVLGVLSDCGRGRAAVLCLVESREHHSHAGRVGCSGGTDGSVPGALPQDED